MDAFFDRFARIPIFQKILGLIGICLLLIAVYYFVGYSAQQAEQERLRGSISRMEKSLAEKKKMVGDLSQYKREVEKLNQDLNRALKLLPNRSEIPSLLQKISSLAKKSGLDILKFQPSPEIPQDFYAKVPVSLQLRGSFNEITNFFDAVGKLSRIVNIGNFSFQVSSKSNITDKSRKRVLDVKCVATTFRFIPQAVQAAPPVNKKAKGRK